MATLSQSSALSILKFDDSDGKLILQSQLDQGKPAGEKDLFQWRDSLGNPLAAIAYNPAQGMTAYLKLYDTVYTPGFPYGLFFKATYASIATFGSKVFFDGSGASVSWAFRDAGYNEGLTITDHGRTLTTNSAYTGGLTVLSSNASYVPLSIKGAASQTGSLLEWQNNAGTVLAKVNAYGDFFITGGRIMRGPTDYGANINVNNESDIKGIIIRANASQTLNLQEWQNSSGTVLTKVDSTGQITSTNGTQYGTIGSSGFQSGGSSGITDIHYNAGNLTIRGGSAYNSNTSLLVGTGYAAGIGQIIKGVASQTANLQEWQNSAGTVLTKVTSSGKVVFGASGGDNLLEFYSTGGGYGLGAVDANGTFLINSLRVGFPYNNYGATASILNNLYIRESSAQTADAFQVQNSSGTVLSSITNNGFLNTPAILENPTISATAATGTINYDLLTNKSVTYYTSNASANWTLNIRGNSSTTLDSLMAVGQSLTIAFLVTQGSTAYYQSGLQIDGTSVTPKWQGGVAPTFGNASGVDSYSITIMKTASATFTVFESQTRFA